MYKVSDLLGKPVLCLSEARLIGTIANIYLDPKAQKGAFAMLYTDEEEKIFLPLPKLVGVSQDAAVAVSADGISYTADGLKCPINCSAFNQSGKLLGRVTDVNMDGCKVISFVIGDQTIPSDKLICAGAVLVFNDSGKPIKIKSAAKKDQPKQEVASTKVPRLPAKTTFAPSYDFLLGKKLQRTITTVDGKVIAKEGDDVTKAMLDDAKKEGKLVILALNAL